MIITIYVTKGLKILKSQFLYVIIFLADFLKFIFSKIKVQNLLILFKKISRHHVVILIF